MQLYVSAVSNLADARFFGAYGVSYFGFCFDALNPDAITISQAREISSWLHEPKIIGQFGNHQGWEEMNFVHQQMPLFAVQTASDYPERNAISLPKWIQAKEGILDTANSRTFISAGWTPDLLQQALAKEPAGIHIACTRETKPGISRVEYYAALIEILEPYLL